MGVNRLSEIRVTTVADLRGVRQLQDGMKQVIDQSKQIRDLWKETHGYMRGGSTNTATQAAVVNGGHPPNAASQVNRRRSGAGQGISPGTAQLGTNQRRSATAGANMAGMPNLGTTQGIISWYQNSYEEALPMIRSLGGGRGNGISNIGGVRYQGRPVQTVTQTVGPSAQQMKHWFQGLTSQVDSMDMETKLAYWAAGGQGGRYTGRSGPTLAMQDFIDQYGAALGAPGAQTITSTVPIAQSFGQRLRRHFTNNLTGGRTLGGALFGGVKGALGGSLIDAALGGGEAGAAAGGLSAGVIGDLAGGPIGAIAGLALTALGGQLKQGITSWKQTEPAFSQMSHALLNATNGVDGFRLSVQMAGAKVGESLAQSTASAQALSSVYGTSLGMRGLARQVQLTGAFSMVNGLTPAQGTAISATAAQLGITNGRGSTMTPLAYSNMLTNVVQQSRTQGRQGPVFTGLSSVYAGLGAVNPIITSASATAAQYAALNGTGIQGLQGTSGASLMNTMNSSLASGGGLANVMGFAAIYQASHGRINNPWQIQSILEQGTGAKIPGTNITVGSAVAQMAKKFGGGNKYDAAGVFGQAMHLSVNQAMAVLGSGALNAKHISTKNHLTTRATVQDLLNEGSNMKNVEASRAGFVVQGTKAAAYALAGAPTHVSLAGPNGNLYTGNLSHKRSHPSSGTPLTSPIGGNAVRSSVPATLGQSHASFIKAVLPAARTASTKTGYPVADLISEWAYETKWGTSTAAQKDANLAGIIPFGKYKPGLDSTFAGFKNLQQFAQADATVLNNPRYAGAKKLAMSGASPQKVFSALDAEGYTGTPPATAPSLYGAGVQADYQTVRLDRASIDEIVNGFSRAVTHQLSAMPHR